MWVIALRNINTPHSLGITFASKSLGFFTFVFGDGSFHLTTIIVYNFIDAQRYSMQSIDYWVIVITVEQWLLCTALDFSARIFPCNRHFHIVANTICVRLLRIFVKISICSKKLLVQVSL